MAEEKKDNPRDFGKVIDVLHSKQKLPSLRSFQGDMAEYIKERDESVISIALKEKEKKDKEKRKAEKTEKVNEEKQEERKGDEKVNEEKKIVDQRIADLPIPTPKPKTGNNFQLNLTIAFLSLILIAGGAAAFLYVFNFLNEEPPEQTVLEEEIIPYNNIVNLANVSASNLGIEMASLSLSPGTNIIKISKSDGILIKTSEEFFEFIKVSLPGNLERTINNIYAVGAVSKNDQNFPFIVISADNFGNAFSGMLEWESAMLKDLSFLTKSEMNPVTTTSSATSTTATSSKLSTPFKTQAKPSVETYVWKDLIIKNKDTRAFVNEKGESKMAYTFLDKNTILIVGDISIIGDLSAAYVSRSFAR